MGDDSTTGGPAPDRPAKKKMLDLCTGTGSVANRFHAAGWEVVTVDIDPDWEPDICADIIGLDLGEILKVGEQPWVPFDWVHASPDCRVFSLANGRRFQENWGTHQEAIQNQWEPRSEAATEAVRLLHSILDIIAQNQELNPHAYWTIENPRALMRRQPALLAHPRVTVTYCQYGQRRMKPTDIWGRHPRSWLPKACRRGEPCHEAAPRGVTTTGTLSLDRAGRIAMPALLIDSWIEAAELDDGRTILTLEDF